MRFKELLTGDKFRLIHNNSILMKIPPAEEINHHLNEKAWRFNTVVVNTGTLLKGVTLFVNSDTQTLTQE